MKNFLERIKIYVEVFSYLIIGIGGLLITYFQYKISEQDLLINKSEVLPLIRIKSDKTYEKDRKSFATESLNFYNDGGPAKDFHTDIKTYILVHFPSKGKRDTSFIYIQDFFGEQYYTGNYKENILECYKYFNYKKFRELENYLSSKYSGNDYFLTKETIIKISFKDILDTPHKEYFKSNTQNRYVKITEQNAISTYRSKDKHKAILAEMNIDYLKEMTGL